MAEDDFDERFAQLRRLVGKGDLKGQVEVDQVYARYVDGWGDVGDDTGVITPEQESAGPRGKPGPSFDHPRGGEAGYLTHSINEDERGGPIAQSWADAIGDEIPLDTQMIHSVEDIAAQVAFNAPREFWLLRGSAHPSVTREGALIYDRPPEIPRAPEEMLQAMKLGKEEDVLHANEERRRPHDLTPPVVESFGGGVV